MKKEWQGINHNAPAADPPPFAYLVSFLQPRGSGSQAANCIVERDSDAEQIGKDNGRHTLARDAHLARILH